MGPLIGAATCCWHCRGSLIQFGRIHFAKLTLRDGNEVRVHKCCLASARETQRDLTAQPPGARGEGSDADDSTRDDVVSARKAG